jgi:sarcosine oxidase
VCLYTVTPDAKFVVDCAPSSTSILLASACSGHGFKHSAALGEALAQLAVGEKPVIDLTPFRLVRFATG